MREEKENKYFTPNIEDIRVGYECYWIKDPSKEIEINNLLPIKFTPKQVAFTLFAPINWEREETENFKPNLGSYTVPYLTKEQIEKEGWRDMSSTIKGFFSIDDTEYSIYIPYIKDKYSVSHIPYKHLIKIVHIKDDKIKPIFEGECKDINTFRYICKLLNI